jgi:ribonucleoside-diphosphate reductase alpha chain
MEWQQKISQEIFKQKYMLHGENDELQLFKEIAEEVSSVEKENTKDKVKGELFQVMYNRKFIPAGRILANARPYSKLKNYNNCFVIDVEDSMESITESIKNYMTILKQGGGVGFNISKLRPKNSPLSTGGVSSGPLSFLEIFDQASQTIEVGGQRRGASICILDIDHPDIEEFITFKQGDKNKKLTQFNISVGITDKFIKAVKKDKDWELSWEGKVYKTIKAKKLYDSIVKNAYLYNEPGILNLDTVNKNANSYYLYDIKSVNPCGEITLPSYGVCCLGAINLTKFVKDPFTDYPSFDWDAFEETIRIGVRFLDNVLDVTQYPLEQIKERALDERRIGLGITGLGDTFAMMKFEYGDENSQKFTKEIFKNLRDVSYTSSSMLADEKGVFPKFDKKILDSNFIKRLPSEIKENIETYGLRNIALNTIAPTGTTSFTLGENCSSGIEPIFALEYDRNIRSKDNKKSKERVYDYAYLKYVEHVNKREFDKGGELLPNYFKTALEIDPYKQVDIQAIAQQYIDNSISKTANIPESYSKKDYENLFMYAYEKELKGFTSFRLGSMQGVLETIGSQKEERPQAIERIHAPKRPEVLPCDIHEISVNKERHIVLVGLMQGTLYEIFVTNDPKNEIDRIGKKQGYIKKIKKGQYSLIIENGEDRAVIENIADEFNQVYASLSRFISMGLRHGVPLQFIVDQLNKDKNFIGFEKSVGRVLKKYIKEGERVLTDKCADCGGELIFQEGCIVCPSCGWGKCG